MTGLILYGVSLLIFTIPWLCVAYNEYKSRYGLSGITTMYTFLTLIPFVNIPVGIAGWLVSSYLLSEKVAEFINHNRKY